MRSYKKPLTVLLAVFLLPVLLAGVLFFLVWIDKDHEQLKAQLQAWFKQQTQHELLISGPLKINFYPAFNLSASQVSILDTAQQKLLGMERLLVEADPFSMFDELAIEKIFIEKARLKLFKTEAGIVLFQTKTTSQTPHKPDTASSFPFRNIEVIDSEICLLDTSNQKLAELLDVNASLVSTNNNQLRVKLKADLYALSEQPVDINLTGDVLVTDSKDGFKAEEIHFSSEAMSLDAYMEIEKHKQDLQLLLKILESKPIVLLEQLGLVSGENNDKPVFYQVSGEMKINFLEAENRLLFDALNVDQSLLQGEVIIGNEMLSLDVKIDELYVEPYVEFFSAFIGQGESKEFSPELLSSVHINHLKLEHGEVDQFVNRIHIKDKQLLETEGSLLIKSSNPLKLFKRYTELLKIPDNSVLNFDDKNFNYLDGALSYRFSNHGLALNDMDLMIDDTTVKGQISFKLPVDEIKADMSIGSVNLDRYVALIPSAEGEEPATESTSDDVEGLLFQLEKINGQGSISIDSIDYQGTVYKGINIQFH